MNLTIAVDDEPETLHEFMYKDLNPIFEPFKVKTEKTLRRLLSTHNLAYFLGYTAKNTSGNLNPGMDIVDNWEENKEYFDDVVILKCPKSMNYKYCFYPKDAVSEYNSSRAKAHAIEKLRAKNINREPKADEILQYLHLSEDVRPITQAPREGRVIEKRGPNPFATRKKTQDSKPFEFEKNVLPGSISYESVPDEPSIRTQKKRRLRSNSIERGRSRNLNKTRRSNSLDLNKKLRRLSIRELRAIGKQNTKKNNDEDLSALANALDKLRIKK